MMATRVTGLEPVDDDASEEVRNARLRNMVEATHDGRAESEGALEFLFAQGSWRRGLDLGQEDPHQQQHLWRSAGPNETWPLDKSLPCRPDVSAGGPICKPVLENWDTPIGHVWAKRGALSFDPRHSLKSDLCVVRNIHIWASRSTRWAVGLMHDLPMEAHSPLRAIQPSPFGN